MTGDGVPSAVRQQPLSSHTYRTESAQKHSEADSLLTWSDSSWLGVKSPFSKMTTLRPAAASWAAHGPAPAPDPTITASHFTTSAAPASSSSSSPSGCTHTVTAHFTIAHTVSLCRGSMQDEQCQPLVGHTANIQKVKWVTPYLGHTLDLHLSTRS